MRKTIPDSGFSADDGSADPRLSAALAAWAADRAAEQQVLDALAGARLLVPVVAVLGELEDERAPVHTDASVPAGAPVHGVAPVPEDAQGRASAPPGATTDPKAPSPARPAPTEAARPARADAARPARGGAGLPREKTSDMAVPTLKAKGRIALPAFTSTASLARWDPAARPVAVRLPQVLQAAAHERADTLVLDLAGPVPYQLTGPALRALAEGRPLVEAAEPLADPDVRDAVRAAVAAEPAVLSAHLGPGSADGTLAVVLPAVDGAVDGPAASAALGRLARRLAADSTLRARLVRGLDLAVLPPGARPPGEPLYERPSVALPRS